MRTLSWISLCLLVAGCGSGSGSEDGKTDDGTAEVEDTVLDTVEEADAVPECASDTDCDDGDPCTQDVCDTEFGDCTHESVDADADGYHAAEVDGTACDGTDCDDGDDSIFPGATTGCEEGDDFNCNGVDDRDDDEDGYVSDACTDGDDCDDSDPDAFPGSTLVDCSDLDHDCNGFADRDNDGDGQDRAECAGSDCDDEDDSVYSGAAEVDCDGKDTDCDGSMSTVEDADGDGHPGEACAPAGVDPDCDDGDRYIYPGATEDCDEVDDDCDGSWADGGADDDGDTVLDETCGGRDCDDTDSDIHPGSTLVDCSTTDHDCNGHEDRDNDGDGHDRDSCGGDDCDDTDATFHPGSTAIDCSTLDHDCNGLDDIDNDGDGHDRDSCGGDDCDDAHADAHPGGHETCADGIDQDCDTVADDSGPFFGDVRITNDIERSDYAWLAWSGSEYGLIWGDRSAGNADIYFARVSADGVKLGADERITVEPEGSSVARVVWTGSEYAAVWRDDRDASEIYFGRISPAGTEIGSEVRVSDSTVSAIEPATIWTGSELGVVWMDYRDGNNEIYFARVSPLGVRIGPEVRLTTDVADKITPEIAWTGSEFGVAWPDYRLGSFEVFMTRVSAVGVKLGSDVRISDDDGEVGYRVSLAWSGSEFGLGWQDGRHTRDQIYFARVSASGTKIGSDMRITTTTTEANAPSLVWTGSEFAMSWYDRRDAGDYEIYAALVSPTGTLIGSEVRITSSLGWSHFPRLAWTGSEYGVAWHDQRDGNWEIYFNLFALCP